MPVPHSETYGKQATPPKTSSTLRLEINRISNLWPRKIFIQWTLRNPPAATGYTFNVYRSGGPEGPWEKLTDDLVDTFYYLDDDFPGPHDRSKVGHVQMRMSNYYRVTVKYGTDPEAEAVHFVDGAPDHRRAGMIRKLMRDAYLSLRKGNGTEVAILKRMWYGEPCTICRSSVGQTTRAHCSTCNGTGIIQGYWNPVYTYARRTETPQDTRVGPQGKVESNRLMVYMPYFPEVEVEDILVFLRDNRRYIIEQVSLTSVHAVTVHQECSVSELSRTSREYNMKVDPWHDPKWY
jgi:hypothetical protein